MRPYTGPVITTEESARSSGKYLFTLDERRAADGKGRANRARYVNYSCRPNSVGYTFGRRIWVCALRAVEAGEQISIDYGAQYLTAHFGPQGCRCEPCAAAAFYFRPRLPQSNICNRTPSVHPSSSGNHTLEAA